MEKKKFIVTLIGKGQAEMGRVFIHKGLGSKCEGCEYSLVCVKNLEPERVYKIVNVRKKTILCRLYETDMQVVEVVQAETHAAVPSKQSIEKALVTIHPHECQNQDCINYDFCSPIGLSEGDRCEILAIDGALQCPQGLPLKKVLLRRVPVF